MGQKTNSNFLRLGIANTEWKAKYCLQTLEESSFVTFNHFQLQTYIKKFFYNYGLYFHDYKFCFNTFNIHLYISYYNGLKSVAKLNNQYLKFKKNNHFSKKHFLRTKFISKQTTFVKLNNQHLRKIPIKQLKKFILKKKFENYKNLKNNSFIEKLLESLQLFFGNKYNIYITFQNLNSTLTMNLTKNEQKLWKKTLLILKKYSTYEFFKETINILFITTKSTNSAQLLADFISKQLSVLKRQSYFLIFIKRVLNLFVKSNLTKINGLKLMVNGRFNRATRARSRIIIAGNIPTQTLKNNINYYQSVAFSFNGTFGVKVWINE